MPTTFRGGGDAATRRMQQILMIQELMNKSPAYGAGEVDRVMALQDKQRLSQLEEERLERGSQALISERENRTAMGWQDLGSAMWKRESDIQRDIEKGAREERITGATIPKLEAETETQRLTGKLRQAETKTEEAKRLKEEAEARTKDQWSQSEAVDAIKRDARGAWNGAVSQALAGNMEQFKGPNAKENTDLLEKAGQILNGPGFKVPRDATGAWAPDPKSMEALAGTVTNDKGEYTAEFQRNVHDANKASTPFSGWLQEMNKAVAEGNEFEAQMLLSRLEKETMVPLNTAKGELVMQQIRAKNPAGALEAIKNIAVAEKAGKASSVRADKALADIQELTSIYADLGQVREQYQELIKKGKVPVGAMHRPFLEWIHSVEASDPEIVTFRGNMDKIVAQYINKVTGKQSNESEREELKRAIVSTQDSTSVFPVRLDDMIRNTARKAQERGGFYTSLGIPVPSLGPNLPWITPAETMKRWGGDAAVRFEDGLYVPFSEGATLDAGKKATADQLRRNGQQIGGLGEARDKTGVRTTAPLGVQSTPTTGPGVPQAIATDISGMSDQQLQDMLNQARKEVGK